MKRAKIQHTSKKIIHSLINVSAVSWLHHISRRSYHMSNNIMIVPRAGLYQLDASLAQDIWIRDQ